MTHAAPVSAPASAVLAFPAPSPEQSRDFMAAKLSYHADAWDVAEDLRNGIDAMEAQGSRHIEIHTRTLEDGRIGLQPGTSAASCRRCSACRTVAERTAQLIGTQKRSNPELTVATSRERGAFGERYSQTVQVGIRIPLGAGPRHDARIATAQAEAIEVQSQLVLEQARIQADKQGAAARLEAARTQLDAAQRRAQLANESRSFFDKSFRLGETDLPTRLRIEAEAAEAMRQAARSQIDLASAISAWRQSLGLLPE